MNQLSPAAQVMIAVTHVYQDHGGDPPAHAIAAAALRAAADQFFTDWDGMCCEEHLKSIANELEAQ